MATRLILGNPGTAPVPAAIAKPGERIRLRYNIWGNWVGFVGTRRAWDGAAEFDAKTWGAVQVAAGATVSPFSEISASQLAAHAALVLDPAPRDPVAEAAKLAAMVLALSPTAGTLGEGMARQLHAQARRVLEASK